MVNISSEQKLNGALCQVASLCRDGHVLGLNVDSTLYIKPQPQKQPRHGSPLTSNNEELRHQIESYSHESDMLH